MRLRLRDPGALTAEVAVMCLKLFDLRSWAALGSEPSNDFL